MLMPAQAWQAHGMDPGLFQLFVDSKEDGLPDTGRLGELGLGSGSVVFMLERSEGAIGTVVGDGVGAVGRSFELELLGPRGDEQSLVRDVGGGGGAASGGQEQQQAQPCSLNTAINKPGIRPMIPATGQPTASELRTFLAEYADHAEAQAQSSGEPDLDWMQQKFEAAEEYAMWLLRGMVPALQTASAALASTKRSKALVLRVHRKRRPIATARRAKRGWKPLMGDVTVLLTVLDVDMKARLLSTPTTKGRQDLLEAALEDRDINAGKVPAGVLGLEDLGRYLEDLEELQEAGAPVAGLAAVSHVLVRWARMNPAPQCGQPLVLYLLAADLNKGTGISRLSDWNGFIRCTEVRAGGNPNPNPNPSPD
jgi:hypothetical protein